MTCRFLIADELITKVKAEIAANGQYSFDMPLQYEDEAGVVYAMFTKNIYVASKDYYRAKLQAKMDA